MSGEAGPVAETTYDVGVVGLGYVGLTLATALADVGLSVFSVERRPEVVEQVTRAGDISTRPAATGRSTTSATTRRSP